MSSIGNKKILITTIILAIYLNYKHQYNPQYKILSNTKDAFAQYEDGFIYIGNKKYIDNIKIKDGDILIEDKRLEEDPDIVIYDSYEIKNKDLRNTVLEVICCYEKENPSNWNRSIESMRLEWFIHNVCYQFKYKPEHTMDVNLNNADEEKYNNKIIQNILKI